MKTLSLAVCIVNLLVTTGCQEAEGLQDANVTTNMNNAQLTEQVQQQEDRIRQLEKAIIDLKASCQPRAQQADEALVPPPHPFRGKRQLEGFIGFTAYLDRIIDHLGIGQTIVFDRTLLNEQGAYNTKTGHFTCLVTGFYAFSFYVYTNNNHQFVGRLVVDGVNQLDGISDSYHDNQEVQGGNFLVLHLRVGQVVSIQNYRWTDTEIEGTSTSRMASFSGFLIYL